MKSSPVYWQKAKKILSKRDPVLRKIIKKYKKGLFLVVKKPLLYFLIIFLNTGSLLDNIFLALCQYEGGLLIAV